MFEVWFENIYFIVEAFKCVSFVNIVFAYNFLYSNEIICKNIDMIESNEYWMNSDFIIIYTIEKKTVMKHFCT